MEVNEIITPEQQRQYEGWVNSKSASYWERIMYEGRVELEPCGCVVEPDGECGHGFQSPLLYLGMI